MSWSKAGIVLAVTLAVAGCGFRPLYAPPAEDTSADSVYAFDALKKVSIGLIPDREGQYLRNRLIRLLHPFGRGAETQYVLNVTVSEGRTELAVQKSAVATRANLNVTGVYVLIDAITGKSVTSGSVNATSGFNIFQSEFQTVIAEQGARERALNSVAEDMRLRLAGFLTRTDTSGGPS